MMHVQCFTDGGARGNPGPAAIGGVIFDAQGNVCAEISATIGATTNNVAEYEALIATLEEARALGATHVDCRLDSELVVRQMNREYRVKDPRLAQLFIRVGNVAQSFAQITFTHIPRSQNKHADRLVNRALDETTAKILR